jgi:twitching motility protein PilT
MAQIDELLRYLKENKGSDLHLTAGMPPCARVRGEVKQLDNRPHLGDAELRGMLAEVSGAERWKRFEEERDLDFAYGLEGVARFRANYFVQHRGVSAVFRIIPEQILSLEQLEMPPVIAELAELHEGLVLVTGPTGSGKSTTLAAIVDRINARQQKHIITIEDPVEFVHPNKRSVLSHREVGTHTKSFGAALRGAMREDPDVILVGEMRDQETIGLALTAAEMGALVFGTLHTNSAAKTVDRLVDAFPADQQDQVRLGLSESLAAVVSQLLLRTVDGKGRCAALEVLLRTTGLGNVIREGNTPMLNNIIQGGRPQGMRLMDDSLFELVKSGRVSAEVAYRKAQDKNRFESLLPAES